MKKLIFIFMLVCLTAYSQEADKLFKEANDLYRSENYEAAASRYEQIVAQHKVHSAEVYFNLANSYYKLDKIAPAVFNYERALLLNPKDEDIRTNLSFAHKMMIDEVTEVPAAGFADILAKATSVLSYNGWAWAAVGCAMAFLLLFCGYYFSGTTSVKRVYFVSMLVSGVVLILSVLSAIFERNRQESVRPAIVFEGIVSVRNEPKASAAEGAVIHEGTKVYVMESLDDWRRVKLPNGDDGWIEAAAIKEIKMR